MLTRKVRRSGDGLVIGVPAQLAAMAGLGEGDRLVWEVVDDGVWRLRRV